LDNKVYDKCVSVAIFIQHARHMQHIIFPPVACVAVTVFHIISQMARCPRKGYSTYNMCFDFI